MKDKEVVPYGAKVRNLVKKFGGVIAVDHVNINVKQGEVFSLLGPSGCGKTTTLRIIAGLETADEGEVLIGGKVVNSVPPYKRECNLVFQNLALFPHMTVEQNIAYGLERRKVIKKEIRKKVGEMLDIMHLNDMEKRYPAQISGGQQQRVALARSLVLEPKLLLLDEPLSSLDRKVRKELQIELKRIQQELGITFFYVTHDQKVALAISNTIAVMQEGRLEQVGSSEEIYSNPRTKFIADFMGAVNIFLGKVITNKGGEVYLESECGLRIVALDKKDISGEKTGISVHPEMINVSSVSAGLKRDNSFKGRIAEMIYQGDFVELKVRLLNSKISKLMTIHLNSKLAQKSKLFVGKEVLIQWEKESSNLLYG